MGTSHSKPVSIRRILGFSFINFAYFTEGHVQYAQSSSPGLDGVIRENRNFLTDTCIGDSFDASVQNINKTEIIIYYANYTSTHREEIEQSKNELHWVGKQLFGTPNFRCQIIDGFCSEMPTCEGIAKFMGLQTDTLPTPQDVDELKRRYFLALLLNYQVSFYHTIRVSCLFSLC